MDRITKIIMVLIAAGLWLNAAVSLIKPAFATDSIFYSIRSGGFTIGTGLDHPVRGIDHPVGCFDHSVGCFGHSVSCFYSSQRQNLITADAM